MLYNNDEFWNIDSGMEVDYDEEITDKVWKLFMERMQELELESREGQENMALDICEAIRDDKHIMIEAGVGIGKSYAYLAPLIYYNRVTEIPVIVSTSTILLQEQLQKDIEKMSQIIRHRPRVVVAKGMSHFICKSRAYKYLDNKEQYKWLLNWIENSVNGDRSRLPREVGESIWNKVNVQNCDSNKCDYRDECFFLKRRKEMSSTNGIILCNHDLLAVNLQKKQHRQREILPKDIGLIVIDEAHNLEEKFRNSLKQEWCYNRLNRTVKDAIRYLERFNNYEDYHSIYDKIEKLIVKILEEFYKQAQQQYNELISKSDEVGRYYINTSFVYKEIVTVKKELEKLNDKVQLADRDSNYFFHEDRAQDDIIENFEYMIEFFNGMILKNPNKVYWSEMQHGNKVYNRIKLLNCPLKMNKEIHKLLFQDGKPKTIITSATLTSKFLGNNEDRYSYISNSIGYPIKQGELSDPKKSPYNYDKNCLLYYNNGLAHPTRNRKVFIDKCVEVIIKLLNITEGKSLILFSSKSDMNSVYEQLSKKNLPWKLLRQQESSSQENVILQFKEDVNSVLLGTGVFWEGISIEGETLSNLIIVRLPFPVPDPVIESKKGCSNGKTLLDIEVPEMLIKLRQGVGRLIRNYSDRGIVSILDSRIGDDSTLPYKEQVFEALPIKNKSSDFAEVQKFAKERLNINND